MDDQELETLIREAAPNAAIPADLAARRTAVVNNLRARRRRWRIGASSAVASIVLVGGGSIAIAGGDHMTPWGWVADNSFTIESPAGENCFIGMRVEWDGVSEDDPMVQDAKSILHSLDLQSLNIDDVLAEARARNEAESAVGKRTDDELRMEAIGTVAASTTFDELIARGYEMSVGHEVSISSDGTQCR